MKRLNTTPISENAMMPVKKGTLAFLQDAYKEAINGIASNLVGRGAIDGRLYRLYGCENTGSGLTFTISAGALYYNGEVYLVDAASFTVAAGRTAVAEFITTQYTTDADPVEFTDGISRNVHDVRKIRFKDGLPGEGLGGISDIYETGYIVRPVSGGQLGTTYNVTFDSEKAVYFSGLSSTGSVIGFDFANAVPGCVVRVKVTTISGQSITLNNDANVNVSLEGLGLGSGNTENKNCVFYFMYLGRNTSNKHEVAVNLRNV